jgi:hypothetical protein
MSMNLLPWQPRSTQAGREILAIAARRKGSLKMGCQNFREAARDPGRIGVLDVEFAIAALRELEANSVANRLLNNVYGPGAVHDLIEKLRAYRAEQAISSHAAPPSSASAP